MMTSWKRMETAGGAGVEALGGVSVFSSCAQSRRIHRALRWKKDAVCRETAAADADPELTEAENVSVAGADSTGSSVTRTIFFSSRIQTQPSTRKETPNTTQKEKGKQKQNTVTIRKNLETLA